MTEHTQHDPVVRLTSLAAARIMLRHPDPALAPLVHATFPPQERESLSAAIVEASGTLFEDLAWLQHPLARIARGCGLSAFDLDLLGLAILPCVDDRAAHIVSAMGGTGTRRMLAGLGLQ